MSRDISRIGIVLVVLFLVVAAFPARAHVALGEAGHTPAQPVAAAYGNVPLLFIENRGQVNEAVRYYLPGGDRTIYLTDSAIWVTLREAPPATAGQRERVPRLAGGWGGEEGAATSAGRAVTLKISFPGANPDARLEPLEALETRVSYFIGNDPAKWRTDVPVWSGVRYVNLYPGIDLEVSGRGGVWAWQVRARPEADVSGVQLRVEGAEGLAVEGEQLRVTTALGTFRLPLLMLDGAAVPPAVVEGKVVRAPFAAPGAGAAAIPAAQSSNLLYATFLGGADNDWGWGIALDGAGNAYVTGETDSTNFPTTPGAYRPCHNGGYEDAFVVKVNASGSGLV
ncbi:MAG: hypothetical protein DDG58_05175, partial [Ardenticatenia bacterium]